MNKVKKQKAITLIALVITIVILLILAGISIASLTESKLFEKSKEAKEISQKMQLKEELQILLDALKIDEYNLNRKYTSGEIISKVEEKEYTEVEVDEESIIVQKGDYEFTIIDLIVQEVVSKITPLPEVLENPTFNYNKEEHEIISIKIKFPTYAKIKEYKIGNSGNWQKYKSEIILTENDTIYARYTSRDNRNSEEVSEEIKNIKTNILKYTNASNYMYGDDNAKINAVKKIFDIKNRENLKVDEDEIEFMGWCSEIVYFQDNKKVPIEANKVTVLTEQWGSGHEPVKDFYITASNNIDFSDEVKLYEGSRVLQENNSLNRLEETVHEFEPKGYYQFYRIYVKLWYEENGANGQNIRGCYIE